MQLGCVLRGPNGELFCAESEELARELAADFGCTIVPCRYVTDLSDLDNTPLRRSVKQACAHEPIHSHLPLISRDLDGYLLGWLNAYELGARCARVSRGLRAACGIAWACVATVEFPRLASIAAVTTYPPFDYAVAYRSQLKIRDNGFDRVLYSDAPLGALVGIVLTFEMHTSRCTDPDNARWDWGPNNEHFGRGTGRLLASWETSPPWFTWSGRLTNGALVQTPRLWTSETIPPEAARWWSDAHRLKSDGDFRVASLDVAEPHLRIYSTRNSTSKLLYDGDIQWGTKGAMSFAPRVVPGGPAPSLQSRLEKPEPVLLRMRPTMDFETGRFRLEGELDRVADSAHDAAVLRSVARHGDPGLVLNCGYDSADNRRG